MNVKRIGFISYKLIFDDVEVVTDPLLTLNSGVKFAKTNGDVVLMTDPKYAGEENVLESEGFKKIEAKNRERVFEITSPGEYEIGGVMFRRPIGADYYLIDEGSIRLAYLGHVGKGLKADDLGDMGDVDVLMLPVGDSEIFPSFDKLEAIIKKIDPTYLIPCGYQEPGLKAEYKDMKSVDEFVKQFGYTHVTNEKKFTLKSGTEPDNKVVEVVILES